MGKAIKVMVERGCFEPVRSHPTDAGMDIKSPSGFVVKAHGSEILRTGVHVQIPEGHVGMLKSRSGLNIKHGIITEGVIDEGFTGEIMVKLYNLSDEDYQVRRGDRITQLVVMPVIYPTIEIVDEIDGGERGDAGYGSTGK